ncbi:roadblock/LC7 domain-containing protein [Amycolatopsis rhizosphaerae]|uniref:Roadblock/LC7 domain-containing protein n=1 Tax=Amycolatopsis rhizosphaerae TaxID=2053003 RepID=A0A558CTL9_9PSEU|nr:roadblock/LC7 domain-containing protein [Amycolatopsis rhizosphaerae]TVT52096.1 roadblock/LC7 domain-containing protein [Amycolatopsis rhizosphaerae]
MADDLTWLLSRLAEAVPHTRSALLLSSDGIAKFWHGLDTDGADTLAALSSGLCSLAQQVGTRFGAGEGVRQVVSELGDVILFVTAASEGTVLAVLADREVDAGILSYEMGKLCTQVPAYLATPARQALAEPTNGYR